MSELARFGDASPFDSVRKVDTAGEWWSARDLVSLLGYDRWQNFAVAIDRAMITCANSGSSADEQFQQVTQLIDAGNLGLQERSDYRLTRYACYLVAMNGDPRKPEIAAAQTYFAIRTREAEVAPASTPDVLQMARRLVLEADRADAAERRVAELEGRLQLASAALDPALPPPSPRPVAVLHDPRRDAVADWVRTRTVGQYPGTPGRQLYRAFLADTGSRVVDITEVLFGRTLTRLGHPSKQTGSYWFRPLAVVVTPRAPYATRGA